VLPVRDGNAYDVDNGLPLTCVPESGQGEQVRTEKTVSIKNEGAAGWAVHPARFFGGFSSRWAFLRTGLGRIACLRSPSMTSFGEAGITPKWPPLAKYFGTSEQFWLNLQDACRPSGQKEVFEGTPAIKPLATAAAQWGARTHRGIGAARSLTRRQEEFCMIEDNGRERHLMVLSLCSLQILGNR